ncbi:hypothetical protein LZ554_003153 [Drepanopeziza brunnea f. sp. 'monogermtubi']|nr:hypothetical protein LZ554_003153 [Drepanopeziza brunnea f. sp. 'monogermtubi']
MSETWTVTRSTGYAKQSGYSPGSFKSVRLKNEFGWLEMGIWFLSWRMDRVQVTLSFSASCRELVSWEKGRRGRGRICYEVPGATRTSAGKIYIQDTTQSERGVSLVFK